MSNVLRDAAVLDAQLAMLGKKQMPLATASALNKSAALARTRVIKGVAKQTDLQQKLLRARIYVSKARRSMQRATIRAYVRGISMIKLNPRDTGKGGWRTRRGAGVKARGGHHYPDAFIAKGKHGKQQVFERNLRVSRREGRAYHHVDVIRIPIEKEVETIAPRVARRVMTNRFPGLLQHEIDWRLARVGAK